MSVFPENKTSDFKVHLPKSVTLEGSWKCGLAEIQYPRSWYSISQSLEHWVQCRQDNIDIIVFLSLGYYQNPRNVIDQLNREMEKAFAAAADMKTRDLTSRLTTIPRLRTHLHFNPYSQVASLEIQKPQLKNMRVALSIPLARMLGFDTTIYRQSGFHVASRVVNLNNTNTIFVYLDVIQSQIIGDTLTPLLDVIAVQGEPGNLVCRRFDKLHYKPILRKHFSDIHISLRDDQGEPIRFEKGKVIVTLHLRRAKLSL